MYKKLPCHISFFLEMSKTRADPLCGSESEWIKISPVQIYSLTPPPHPPTPPLPKAFGLLWNDYKADGDNNLSFLTKNKDNMLNIVFHQFHYFCKYILILTSNTFQACWNRGNTRLSMLWTGQKPLIGTFNTYGRSFVKGMVSWLGGFLKRFRPQKTSHWLQATGAVQRPQTRNHWQPSSQEYPAFFLGLV